MSLPQLDLAGHEGPRATFKTSMGNIEVALFPQQAPKAVENFIGLAKQGYYDDQIFHRVIPDFMIQGGDPTGTGAGGASIWGDSFKDEFSSQLFNLRGALSMANAGPNTNGSQFFIVVNQHIDPSMVAQMKQAGYPQTIIDAYQNGGTPWLDGHHTVFGQVVKGFDIADSISKVATKADKPVVPVKLETVTVVEA